MSARPDVTVVIPTRDRYDLLSTAALPSALGQQDVDFEVVVVDDGSTDPIAERLATLGEVRLRVIRHDRARGVAQARNAGIRTAHGEWIAFLDDDDLWAPYKLRLQLEAARAGEALFVYGGAAAVAEDRSWLYSLAPADPARLRRSLLSRNVLWGGCSNVVVRADVLRRLGGFDERLFQLCDWDLWIRLAHAGNAAVCEQVLVGCIEHRRSMLLTSEDDVLDELDYLVAKHRETSEVEGVTFDRALFTRWVAIGHGRAGRRFHAAKVYLRGALANRDPADVARAFDALLSARPSAWTRRALRRPSPDGRLVNTTAEPTWLELYRRTGARTSPQATSNGNSSTD